MARCLKKLWQDDSGASAVEYGLLVGLIALVIIGAVTGIGTQLKANFEAVETALTPVP